MVGWWAVMMQRLGGGIYDNRILKFHSLTLEIADEFPEMNLPVLIRRSISIQEEDCCVTHKEQNCSEDLEDSKRLEHFE